jgi:glycine dehydrogenase subunit 1
MGPSRLEVLLPTLRSLPGAFRAAGDDKKGLSMRYLPLSDVNRADMLARIGVSGIDALFADIPADKLLDEPLDLPRRKGEFEVERILARMAARNVPASSVPFFVGAGAYKHHVPASVDHLIQRSEFLTSYTPYQPEIAQGTLQYLFEFQTQVANLTAMDVANASMYDGSTGTAEAVLMAHRVTKRRKAVLSGGLHPHYVEVVKTVSGMAGDEVVALAADVRGTEDLLAAIDNGVSCVVVQTPDFFGNLRDLRAVADKAHQHGALLVAVFTEAVSLGLVTPPGKMGADIVVGEGQSIGNALSFGGPYVGLFATRQKYVRQMPGRLCGETVDADGWRGFVLTLSTREQHIRRDKATSNICTNSGLCCLAFTIHMTLLGEAGLKLLARINHANAVKLAEGLAGVKGVELLNQSFFNEFTVRLARPAAEVVERLAERGILAGVPVSRLLPDAGLDNLLLVASTEVNTDEDLAALVRGLKDVV